ncbi:DEAD/DEAH box helicase [Nitrosomonas sp. Nm132]|uniref:helicase-related protein n=1 Tax=Nitrosomonas sp. Nm132 TaxID=1881053 RepID=UPI0008903E5F|nr:DEAD/DEAH box helicase [Nitrosomonas sp. Nm132]SDH26959.1 Superfamily II DNA or RNA helicase, SNF2 family [Nitrosomonas sp. Nm132]
MKPIFFLKAAIPPGARWITVHPNGKDAKGQPLLIQEESDGSMRVIGGAGGKLNYLKLRNVRSESDYKKEAAERRKAQTEQRKEQRKKDKELGIGESKTKVRQAIIQQRKVAEKEYVQAVAQSMSWDQSSLEFPEKEYGHLSEATINKLRNTHHKKLLEKAKQAVELQRQKLLSSEEARLAAGIGEIPLNSQDEETLSVDDLDPVPSQSSGLGYDTNYKGRAEQAGLTDDELSVESNKIRSEKLAQLTDAQRMAAIRRGEASKLLRAELENIREPVVSNAVNVLDDAKAAVELLKAEKKLKAINQQAKVKLAEVDAATSKVEPKAFVLEYSADPDLEKSIAEDIENDLRTAQTRTFLAEFQRLAGDKPEETVGKYMGIGAYNSINSLALAVGGDALVDRSVVDVLGIAGAAQVLARRIHNDLKEDVDRIAEGMQEFHLHHYMETSEQALGRARELMDVAREIEIGEGATGADLKTAQELNSKRRTAVTDAQKIVGQALGEMEANAALVVALKQGAKDSVQVPLGNLPVDSTVVRARAIGLQRGDYQIDDLSGQTFLTINADGMDRLAKPVNRADVEQIKRNLSIMRGDHDEDGWLPLGVANRPDLAMEVKPGIAPRLAEPFQPGEDLEQSLRDYIGGRTADGDTPADILADIQSLDFFQKAGSDEAYRAALDVVAPLKDQDGKIQRAESLSDHFEQYADQFVQSRYGGSRSPINRQKFEINQKSVDALHRALSEAPEGVAAYKQIGELTHTDQRTLREYFYRHVAKETPESSMLRQDLEQLDKNEPEKEFVDMFGDTATNPEWSAWRNQRDELAAKVNAASLTWDKYIDTMRGHEKAYESIQDMIRSRVSKKFVDEHNKLNPDNPLKIGRSVIRNNLNHLDATDQETREARMAEQRQLIDSLRERSQGRYAAGSVSDKLDAVRERQEAFEQSQMDFFSTEEMPAEEAIKELRSDERHTVGHEAERQIAGMMGIVGKNFKPGQPVKLWNPSMSGGDNYARQRAIKLIQANKRIGLHLGAGSGKTLVGLGGFTHLHQQGLVKRGIAVVPSIVQGQFSGEAIRYLEPNKFNWHIEPGANRAERIAAYKNPDNHLCVVTHQSLRDDLLYLGSQRAGIPPKEMSERVSVMTHAERKEWARDLMEKEGIDFQYMMIDEGHNLLDRQGKEDSAMSNVIGSFSANTPYYVSMTADPVRNDASEIFSALQKVAPERYTDRAEFMRRYGTDTLASKDALRREMARYFYPHKIEPKVNVKSDVVNVPLSEGQKHALSSLDKDLASMRIARMQGKVDIEAAKRVNPAMFDGVPEDRHESIAKSLQNAIGIVRESATQRIINAHPESAKLDEVAKQVKARSGKPGIIFSHSLEAVESIKSRLEKEGMRVVTISGADSSAEKDRKRKMFSPDGGEEPKVDILVASDAASTGLNAQRGQYLIQYDVVNTAMTHAQRRARIHRIGQKNDIELIDLVGDHPSERRARDRLAKKYQLRDLTTSPLEGLDDTGLAYFLRQRELTQNQGGLF